LKTDKDSSKEYTTLKISGLKKGVYQLNFKVRKVTIEIVVHQGVYWETDTFILKKDCLFENKQKQGFVKISNVGTTKGTDKGMTNFKVNLDDFQDDCRVHAYACQFLPHNPY
jgi:hypothetical protein